jgi:glycerol kinase
MILALDQGTTSSRAILFDETGAIRASAQREFTQFFPQPGWVEHDAMEIWRTQRDVAWEAAAQSGGALRGIGITNQRETVVVWDRRTGEPVSRAIVWQDRRTAGICEELKNAGAGLLIQEKTGLVIDPYFSATKLRWILEEVPGARKRAERGELAFGTVDSWLVWNLSGGAKHISDVTNASRTMLWNIHTAEWDDELLALFSIPRALLPEVVSSSGIIADAAEFGVPIAGIAGDQQAALFGQCCFEPGMAKNTYGTGCFILLNTGSRPVSSRNQLLTTAAWRIGGKMEYALEGSVFIAGAVVQWLRDGLGLIGSSSEIEALAASVPDTGGVYFVPAFVGLGAPYWDSAARGAIFGITRGTSGAHLARAAVESIAHQSADVISAMEADAGFGLQELRVDGGASRNDMLMQFQADLLGVPVVRAQTAETTALGAAFLAGLALGEWRNAAELSRTWSVSKTFSPQMSPAEREARRGRWSEAVARSRHWVVT